MNLRWLRFDFMPPELGLTTEQRKQLRALAQRGLTGWRAAACAVIPGAFGMTAIVISNKMIANVAGPAMFIFTVATALAIIVVLWIGMAFLRGMESRPHIQRALHQMGYHTCHQCCYWLRGLENDARNCPECGSRLMPPPRRLSALELADKDTMQMMNNIGYDVCMNCGLLMVKPLHGDPAQCPECRSPQVDQPVKE